jgi:hypothetical protein
MNATQSLAEIAQEAYGYFETRHRPDGEAFTATKDDAPEWVNELVHHAHGRDFLPDDWRYRTIRNALGFIADNDAGEEEAHEFADQEIDIYTGDRLAWLSSNLNRAGYCDEAAMELGAVDLGIAERIGLGQYQEAGEVYALVCEALAEEAEERDA